MSKSNVYETIERAGLPRFHAPEGATLSVLSVVAQVNVMVQRSIIHIATAAQAEEHYRDQVYLARFSEERQVHFHNEVSSINHRPLPPLPKYGTVAPSMHMDTLASKFFDEWIAAIEARISALLQKQDAKIALYRQFIKTPREFVYIHTKEAD